MARPTFYDVVIVRRTEETERWGIAGKRGVVLGVPDPDEPGEFADYAVSLGPGIGNYMVREDELVLTGERVEREAIYDGTSIRVTVEGEVVTDDGDDESGRAG